MYCRFPGGQIITVGEILIFRGRHQEAFQADSITIAERCAGETLASNKPCTGENSFSAAGRSCLRFTRKLVYESRKSGGSSTRLP